MHIYAIGDLHLSFGAEKPMDVFGERWRDHPARLAEAWRACVNAEDLVLVPGDVSWAMQLDGAAPDFSFLGALPGSKLLLRGNHDYWWSSLKRVRAALPEHVYALQNDAFLFGGYAICGTRGWTCPGGAQAAPDDERIYARELQRMALSLAAAPDGMEKIVMTHYPPFAERGGDSGFTAQIEESGAKLALYGHLHGAAHRNAFEGERNGVTYRCVSADFLGFRPMLLV